LTPKSLHHWCPEPAILGQELIEALPSGQRHVEAELVGPTLLDLGQAQHLGDGGLEGRDDRLGQRSIAKYAAM
jgi:hypothetical protein